MPRLSQPNDMRLLDKVSRLYYEQEFSEGEIAGRLHLSRSKVSRLLKKARELGVVQITVVSPPGFYPALESGLEKRYGLQEAIVVGVSDPESSEAVARELGVVAARHLQQVIREGDVIGISWGRTLNALIANLNPSRPMNNHVVQIIGGLGPPTAEIHATDLCRRMASALNCGLTLLPAPGIVASPQVKQALLLDRYIQQALSLYSSINLAFVGIGAPTPDSVVMRDGSIMNQAELDELLEKGAVGDIALRFFDAQGRAICSDLDERVIGITLEELQRVQCVVGVAGGTEKTAVIRGALLGGYVNALITDQSTAMNLLE